MRVVVLTIAVAFILMLGVLTALDFSRYGITAVGVLAVLVLTLFMIGIVGALRAPPRK